MQNRIAASTTVTGNPLPGRENLPCAVVRRKLAKFLRRRKWSRTQPIDQSLLELANQLIRDHEDTLSGIEATGVIAQRGAGIQRRVFSG
jgi:hypothetical protein